MAPFVFPEWTTKLRNSIGLVLPLMGLHAVLLVWYCFSAKTLDVGYQPTQPVPFSHALHAGELGLDCRYCHNTVEYAAVAAIPPTFTCMNCHQRIRPDSRYLLPVRESWATGKPMEWVRVHNLPDFVYFNHSAHVQRGVGCVSCHGRIDQMPVVYQHEELSMSWCLDCHREPEAHLRPPELVTQMDYVATDQLALGLALKQQRNIKSRTDCSTCHR